MSVDMERTRLDTTLSSASTLPERVPLSAFFERLRTVAERPGPFLSCYLPVQTSDDLSRSRAAISTADVSDDEAAGLQRMIDEVERRARDGESTDAMAVVLQAADGVAFIEFYPETVAEPIIERGPIPRLAAVVEAEQRLRHHVLAVISDEGIDLLTFPRHGEPTLHRSGETDPNRLAHLIHETVKATDTRLVLLAGAVDTVTELRRQLRLDVPIETVVEAVPASGVNPEELVDATVQRVSNQGAVRTVEALRGWRFERAHGQALSDLVGSVRALRGGNARLLLVSDDVDDRRQVWVGPSGHDLAIDLEDAAGALGSVDLFPVRSVDGLVRSALLQQVPIQVVPSLPDSTLPGGIGVLYDASAT